MPKDTIKLEVWAVRNVNGKSSVEAEKDEAEYECRRYEIEANRQHDLKMEALREENKRLTVQLANMPTPEEAKPLLEYFDGYCGEQCNKKYGCDECTKRLEPGIAKLKAIVGETEQPNPKQEGSEKNV